MKVGDSVTYVSQVSDKEFPATILTVNKDGTVDVQVGSSLKQRVPVWTAGPRPVVELRGQQLKPSFVKVS